MFRDGQLHRQREHHIQHSTSKNNRYLLDMSGHAHRGILRAGSLPVMPVGFVRWTRSSLGGLIQKANGVFTKVAIGWMPGRGRR